MKWQDVCQIERSSTVLWGSCHLQVPSSGYNRRSGEFLAPSSTNSELLQEASQLEGEILGLHTKVHQIESQLILSGEDERVALELTMQLSSYQQQLDERGRRLLTIQQSLQGAAGGSTGMCVAFMMQHWVVRHGAVGIDRCPLENEKSSYLIHSLAVTSTAIWTAKGILLAIMCTFSAQYSKLFQYLYSPQSTLHLLNLSFRCRERRGCTR